MREFKSPTNNQCLHCALALREHAGDSIKSVSVGDAVVAQSLNPRDRGTWYLAKVLRIDAARAPKPVLVSYRGFGKSHDRWLTHEQLRWQPPGVSPPPAGEDDPTVSPAKGKARVRGQEKTAAKQGGKGNPKRPRLSLPSAPAANLAAAASSTEAAPAPPPEAAAAAMPAAVAATAAATPAAVAAAAEQETVELRAALQAKQAEFNEARDLASDLGHQLGEKEALESSMRNAMAGLQSTANESAAKAAEAAKAVAAAQEISAVAFTPLAPLLAKDAKYQPVDDLYATQLLWDAANLAATPPGLVPLAEHLKAAFCDSGRGG